LLKNYGEKDMISIFTVTISNSANYIWRWVDFIWPNHTRFTSFYTRLDANHSSFWAWFFTAQL